MRLALSPSSTQGRIHRLIRSSARGEIVVGERAATATCGAFELVKRDAGYVLMGMVTPTRSPVQRARRPRRRRLLLLAAAILRHVDDQSG